MLVISALAVSMLVDPWTLEHSSLASSTVDRVVYSYVNTTGAGTYFGGPGAPSWAQYAVTSRFIRTVAVDEDKNELNGWSEPSWSTPWATLGDFSVDLWFTQDNSAQTLVPDSWIYEHKASVKTSSGYERWREPAGYSYHSAWRNRRWQTLEGQNRAARSVDPD